MDGSLGLIARLPALQVDWGTLVSVNLPTLLFVALGVHQSHHAERGENGLAEVQGDRARRVLEG